VATGALLALFSGIFWVWLVPLGCAASLMAGLLVSRSVDTPPRAA